MCRAAIADKIRSGEKRFLIRRPRKSEPYRVGEDLMFRYRLPDSRDEAAFGPFVCTSVLPITVRGVQSIEVSSRELTESESLSLAKSEGFDSVYELVKHFFGHRQRTNFCGHIVRW